MVGARAAGRPPEHYRAVRPRGRRGRVGPLAVLAVGAALVMVVLGVRLTHSDRALSGAKEVTLMIQDRAVATVSGASARRLGTGAGALPISGRRRVRQGRATITYGVERSRLRRRLAAVGVSGGRVEVPLKPLESRIAAPAYRQRYRNNCETAALSMLLKTRGISVDQETLQRNVRHDGPKDPRTAPDGTMIWGDPRKGYVGRVEGGGTWGGFGVYQRPILELSRRWATPVDLTGKSAQAIYDRLLEGGAVMSWVGLQNGPYRTWRSESGKKVSVNLGEHTVLITGVEGDELILNDPLDGERKRWSKADFELMWERLDRRAISL